MDDIFNNRITVVSLYENACLVKSIDHINFYRFFFYYFRWSSTFNAIKSILVEHLHLTMEETLLLLLEWAISCTCFIGWYSWFIRRNTLQCYSQNYVSMKFQFESSFTSRKLNSLECTRIYWRLWKTFS